MANDGCKRNISENKVRVLNIIGDIGGQTDGTVPNVSSLSLKYLVADRAKSYQVVKFTGKMHVTPSCMRIQK